MVVIALIGLVAHASSLHIAFTGLACGMLLIAAGTVSGMVRLRQTVE
jgi:hypothetical protein